MFEELALFVAVGFAAQLIDGAIGMAYGLFATSVLLSFGVPPATASARDDNPTHQGTSMSVLSPPAFASWG